MNESEHRREMCFTEWWGMSVSSHFFFPHLFNVLTCHYNDIQVLCLSSTRSIKGYDHRATTLNTFMRRSLFILKGISDLIFVSPSNNTTSPEPLWWWSCTFYIKANDMMIFLPTQYLYPHSFLLECTIHSISLTKWRQSTWTLWDSREKK